MHLQGPAQLHAPDLPGVRGKRAAMNLTEDDRQLIARAREVGPALRASTGDRDRLAGWLLKELADLAERLGNEPYDPCGEVIRELPGTTNVQTCMQQRSHDGPHDEADDGQAGDGASSPRRKDQRASALAQRMSRKSGPRG
jgi:hypothetical protein